MALFGETASTVVGRSSVSRNSVCVFLSACGVCGCVSVVARKAVNRLGCFQASGLGRTQARERRPPPAAGAASSAAAATAGRWARPRSMVLHVGPGTWTINIDFTLFKFWAEQCHVQTSFNVTWKPVLALCACSRECDTGYIELLIYSNATHDASSV